MERSVAFAQLTAAVCTLEDPPADPGIPNETPNSVYQLLVGPDVAFRTLLWRLVFEQPLDALIEHSWVRGGLQVVTEVIERSAVFAALYECLGAPPTRPGN